MQNNKILIAALILVVILLGAWLVFAQSEKSKMAEDAMMQEQESGSEKMMQEEKKMEGEKMMEGDAVKQDDGMMQKEAMMQKGGTYEAYDSSKLALAKDGKVVLFFRAGWCPTCRALDADIKSNAQKIPSNVTILDVNYDSSADLKTKYGVTTQHTLVQVDESGRELGKWIGSSTLSDLLTKVK